MEAVPTDNGVPNLAVVAADMTALDEPRVDLEEEIDEPEEQKPPAEASITAPSAQGGGKIGKWPGNNVTAQKVVVGIIGREGELIKKLCEEAEARVRILEGPPGSNDHIGLDSNLPLRRHKCLAPWRFGVYKTSGPKHGLIELVQELVGSSASGRYLKDSINSGNSRRRQKALAPWRFQKYCVDVHSNTTLRRSPRITVDGSTLNKIPELRGTGKKESVLLKEAFGSQMSKRCSPRVRISAINAMHSNKKKRRRIDEKTQADILDDDLVTNKDQEAVEASTRKRKKIDHASKSYENPFSLNIGEDKYSTLTQLSHLSSTANYDDSQHVVREKIMELLSDFRKTYEQVLAEEEGIQKGTDLVALKLFRINHNELASRRKYLGSVPGIQVGDVFHLRVELCVVGLHCQHRHVIDFINQEDKTVTSSIVCSVKSTEIYMNCEVFEYSCYGTQEQGWKFDGESLALKNSMDMKTPVRIICYSVKYPSKNSVETRAKKLSTYVYSGLYFVDNFSRKRSDGNKYLFIFQLRRMQGQPNFGIEDLIESKRFKKHSGLYMEDISNGHEKIPISAVNDVDDEPIPLLNYMPKMIYTSHFNLDPPLGCGCINGCSDSNKCACAFKNGGELPFNSNGAILEAKRLVFECGPSCKCPPSCHNRVSQHGIKVQLQVFKTKLMGWGVRSLNAIPSGSFVCEYVGELLTDEEAAGRATDDYIFSIGNNYYDEKLWEGISSNIPALQEGSCETESIYSIDTSECGNVGKFFNHSCTPNLYAQNLLYDHDNKSIPHIVFFAAEDISPMQELTYHYNYAIDEVHDANGNIKKKNCYCGSDECTGRLY